MTIAYGKIGLTAPRGDVCSPSLFALLASRVISLDSCIVSSALHRQFSYVQILFKVYGKKTSCGDVSVTSK
jgi:hypothetical protein